MNIASKIAAALALAASWAVVNAEVPVDDTANLPGIRVVGQEVDGTLVLDDSVSGLSDWATPGLAMPAGVATDSAPTLLVIGHVESWNPQSGELTVSGQRTTLSDDATLIDAPRDIEAPLTAANVLWYLQEGRYVAVAGDTYGGGESLASHVIRLDNEAQPGSAPIYVRGSLDRVDDVRGIAYVGNMEFDLSIAEASDRPPGGKLVEVLGYQSDAGSAVVTQYASLETAGRRGAGAKVAGISGSGVKGISGSGLKGISGNGVFK